MNVIVPIHVEALRVSINSEQTAKPALYDFSQLPQSPMAGGSGQIPAEIFAGGALPLKDEPGIHLHWSIPRAYTQGKQDDDSGSIGFRALPNRWLVTRLIKDISASNADPSGISVTSWILESDAHDASSDAVGESNTTIPWMNDSSDMYGMTFHYSGNRILLDGPWTEPGQGDGYLGQRLQAPFAYGETFTAYYRNCGNIFGLYDDLKDVPSAFGEDGSDHTLSICYVVTGWVSPSSNDTCVLLLNEALKDYQALSAGGNPPSFPDYISGIFEEQLKWTVDCSSLTPTNAGQAQAIMSGTIGSIKWDTQEAHGKHYPSGVPQTDSISLAIGNTPSQALSAYLGNVDNSQPTPDPGDLTSNLEWLLNTLQTGRLSLLGTGEMGVGQLDEYLHTRSFGSKPGGYLWTVRGKMTPNSIESPKKGGEAPLPLSLAQVLADLNDCQQAYDRLNDEILTRQQKLFFDWNFHICSIEANVVPPANGDISSDHSGNYLLDGIMNLLPCFVRTGTTGKITGGPVPYSYAPSPFQIAAPAFLYINPTTNAGLPQYNFNKTINTNAAGVAAQLLDLRFGVQGQIPSGIGVLQQQLMSALSFLTICESGGKDAPGAMTQATAQLQDALATAQILADSYQGITAAAGGLEDIKTNQVDKSLAAISVLCDPTNGIFAQWLPVVDGSTVPLTANESYQGKMDHTPYSNAASWLANGDFKGIKDLLDQLTGQGNYDPFLFDTQTAAIYVAMAHFWRLSQQSPMPATAYYIQMSQQELLQAQTDAGNAGTALGSAIDTWTGNNLAAIGESLDAIVSTTIPGIVTSLSDGSTTIGENITALQTLLTATTGQGPDLSVSQLLAGVQGDDWRQVATDITTAYLLIRKRLPLAQQVSILNTNLLSNIQDEFELANAPADRYWLPAEPVLLMAGNGKDAPLLKPVSRNGRASLLPCRTDAQLVQSATSFTLPSGLDTLASQLDPQIDGLGELLQGLATEGLLLWPESYSDTDSQKAFEGVWSENIKGQSGHLHQVTLIEPPSGFNGLLPYYIAYNRMPDGEAFLPLFILWKVEYVHSDKVEFGKELLPPDFLSGFSVDNYGADYQPLPANAGDFQKNQSLPNFFTISGVIPLSSASTANLCNEIQRYSKNTLNYDPQQRPPASTDKDFDLENEFYQSWSLGKTSSFLSQALSGFNAGMVQRAQDLQVPVNIPSTWFGGDSPLQKDSLWPSQMLHDQSVGWPSAWASEAIDESAFAESKNAIYFSPMRAGFLKISDLQLVDVFGRWARVPPAAPTAIAESLQSQVSSKDHQIYLPPRLIQPSRLLFKWVANDAENIGPFTDWNSHPAADPVLGWLLPNHLDDSLMFYNNEGLPLGEMRSLDANDLRWFTVPGEPVDPVTGNRQLMDNDLDAKNKSGFFRSFMDTFVYPNTTSPASNFRQLLAVIESARQFVITKSMQQDPGLAVLIGQPLVVVRAVLQLECKGLPYTSLDRNTYPRWDEDGPQFTLDDGIFIPYNFANFNDGGIGALQVPVSIGAVDYTKGDQPVIFFDDGLVGYFVNDNYNTLYTPVDLTSAQNIAMTTEDGPTIVSTYNSVTQPVSLTPGGGPQTITMLMDPRASVHAASSILPVNQITLPPGQYARALNRLMISFLTAPLLTSSAGMKVPLPAETGYAWKWWQIGLNDPMPLRPSQANINAFFTGKPQMIVDGWLRLTKTKK